MSQNWANKVGFLKKMEEQLGFRAVKVIRLVARFTVDQYVVAKARDKLKLTDDIMGTKGKSRNMLPFLVILIS